jgi:hypothetical protein
MNGDRSGIGSRTRSPSRRPRPSTPALAALSLIGASFLGLHACLDTNAIDFVPAAITTLPPVDAGPDAEDADLRRPCQRCVESPDDPGPGCGNAVAACVADPVCVLVYQCALARGCLEKADQHDSVTCGVPCAEEAGVRTTTDPVVTLILGVTDCIANNACGAICTGADAGP